jgi:hypothetical protein
MQEKIYLNQYNKPIRCKICGGDMIFQGVGEYQCEKCKSLEYDDYGKVRTYLELHRGATTSEISLATGVNQREINEMLREERFEVSVDSRTFLKCEECGAEIGIGRLCPTCLRLKEAANNKKRKSEELEEKKKVMTGIGMEKRDVATGEKRFKR